MTKTKTPVITLVEDDQELARMMKDFLSTEGFNVFWVDNGTEAIPLILRENPDLVVLDIMLPGGIDGVEVCRQIRNQFSNPVLMLTARDDDISEVAALNTGADGYLNKPVRPHVLLAHINALLRRDQASATKNATPVNSESTSCHIQDLTLNHHSFTLHKQGVEVILTSGEFQLLAILADNPGVPINRDSLYQQLRGIEYDGLDRSIDLRISSLRKKLDDDIPPYQYIKTVRGQGYLLVV